MYHNITYKYYTYTLTEQHHWHSAQFKNSTTGRVSNKGDGRFVCFARQRQIITAYLLPKEDAFAYRFLLIANVCMKSRNKEQVTK